MTKNLLYLDVANMRQLFFKNPDHWAIEPVLDNISNFIQGCRKSNYEPTGFLDFFNVSEDVLSVWKSRREEEIKSGNKDQPSILYQLFEYGLNSSGVKVYRNIELDSDDTLASMAEKDHAAVFSRDYDFMRYKHHKYPVFDVFSKDQQGKFNFHPMKLKPWKMQEKPIRRLIDPPPKSVIFDRLNAYGMAFDPKEKRYGCPSGLVKEYGNPYLILRPLRKALIYRLKGLARTEIIPDWDKELKVVKWDTTLIEGDPEFDDYLEKPFEAIDKWFDLKEIKNKYKDSVEKERIKLGNHLFGVYSLTFYICSMVYDNSNEKLLQWLKEIREKEGFGEKVDNITNGKRKHDEKKESEESKPIKKLKK